MSSRAVVIANGIDLEPAEGSTVAIPTSVTGEPLLVTVGRLEWEKRVDRLLLAVRSVRQHLPGVRLLVCGDGSERQRLEEQTRVLGLEETVRFMGHVDDPTPFYKAADALVSCSVQEGFGLSIAEAMALRCPVISTPAPGLSSTVLDGVHAVLAGGFEADDIADTIVRAFSDRTSLADIADNGRRFAQRLDVRRTVQEYEDLYRQVVERSRR